MMQQTRSNIQMFSRSDDKAMMKQIQNTHSPDAREFDVKLLLYLIEDIFHHYTPSDILGLGLAKISSKCSRGSDAHTTTLALFNILSSYSCDVKVVIALAAFSINWGELWLVHQHYQFNPLAEYLTLFKQPPDLLKEANSLKPTFEALTNLIKAIMDVSKCIVEFKELPPQYITSTMPEMVAAIAHTPSAVYWTIRIIVTCASQIMNITSMRHKYVSIDVLRNKNVLLLISDLDLSNEEHFILCQIHIMLKEQPTTLESQYEVVWFPVVDRTTPWNDEKQQKFEARQASISWYSVYQPLMFDPVVIKYIKEVWHFNKKALLVVLDPQGKVVHPNAIHMCWIWGNMAFPFTSLKEKELWKETRWTMELLADSIDLSILDWMTNIFACMEEMTWNGSEDLPKQHKLLQQLPHPLGDSVSRKKQSKGNSSED
ncbi:Protein SIEVE ELEMENT OCCLUSION B [Camellia lanceoleosa]|uniref:Protein SIEVE ELEMENT OCCLUSION B n=1 Tax=Camellia lanceoleosa TaxID=1840588 RepID=A0ACC0GCA3_9ERIC|nr:Protein SIEVE ELEMENT OCCLUSION B [Camellia lanceoleosa]